MKQLLTLGLSVLLLSACKKDKLNNEVSGLYTEASPVAGDLQLNFINSSFVIETETGSPYQDTFSYTISPGKISLVTTPAFTAEYGSGQTSFDFSIIDNNSFKIQNLGVSIPEAPESYMVFKK